MAHSGVYVESPATDSKPASPGRCGHEAEFVIRHKPPKVLLVEDERADHRRAAGFEPRRQRARAAVVHHRTAFRKEPRVRGGGFVGWWDGAVVGWWGGGLLGCWVAGLEDLLLRHNDLNQSVNTVKRISK